MKKRIEALDSLRGVMAAQITLRPTWPGSTASRSTPAIVAVLAPFLHGPPGHALFFVLSGFGLTRSMIVPQVPGLGARPGLWPYLAHQWRRRRPAVLRRPGPLPGRPRARARRRSATRPDHPPEMISTRLGDSCPVPP